MKKEEPTIPCQNCLDHGYNKKCPYCHGKQLVTEEENWRYCEDCDPERFAPVERFRKVQQ